MHSTGFYNLSTAGYLVSLGLFAIHVIKTRKLFLKLGVLVVAVSFLVQTCGLVFRWIEAGFLEISAVEKALGKTLTSWSWFVVFTQHPPWSNLYEIMVYMSWGIVMVTLIFELKWQIAFIRQLGIILALMALGMAALTDATITPLVPALKSWWIMIHVISASIAYASGFIAAFICLFALMKDEKRVKKDLFMSVSLIFLGALLFALAGGIRLFSEQDYFVKLLSLAGETAVGVLDFSKGEGEPYFVAMPYVGYLLIITICAHILFGVFWLFKIDRWAIKKINCSILFLICFLLSFLCLAVMLFLDSKEPQIILDMATSHHLAPSGAYFIGFKSHTWSLSLLIFTVIIEGIILLYLLKKDVIIKRLPSVLTLENASYKAISLSFFLMTLVLITGALWAHYAWGRYWAWDPKETGALFIWLNYAIYLHAFRTKGLSGPIASVIGLMGFFVIIIGFLGVNLGLFADGLHTYGNS